MSDRSARLVFGAVLGATLALACVNIAAALRCGSPAGCMDPYWANFWLIGYEDGYLRRALLGQLIAGMFGDPVHYLAINVLALAFACSVPLFVAVAYAKARAEKDLLPILLVFSGPASVLLIEVLGDPMHLGMVLTVLYVAFLRRLPSNWVTGLGVFLAVFTTMLHEASAFLLLPCLYVTRQIRLQKSANLLASSFVVAAAALTVALATRGQVARGTGTALLTTDDSLLYADVKILPDLLELLGRELQANFGSLTATARTAVRLFRALLYPLAAILVLRFFCGDRLVPRLALFLGLQTLPLFVIAHDWGRFGVYVLLLSMSLSALAQQRTFRQGPTDDHGRDVLKLGIPHFPDAVSLPLGSFTQRAAPRLAVAGVLTLATYQGHDEYRMYGMTNWNLAWALAGVILVVALPAKWDLFGKLRTAFLCGAPR